ncbi:MAG: asparagine synthase (glutamine-hydrolyzing), partial [Anaerolineae bacterium]
MCGITGVYALNGEPIESAEISAQVETLVHRGPDQGAIFLSQNRACGLGVRRLSIIDVAGGRQPLGNEEGSAHLVYNGETYNHQALRADLGKLGHRPRTRNDGEVVLHGYEAWGPEATLRKMRGMAAFALWDEGRQQLWLARDRFGIKPLYYAVHRGRLHFASEIKAMLARPDFPRRVNLAALEAMLTVGFVPGPATMFAGVYKLPPAHYLIARNGRFQIRKYWQLDYREDYQISEDEAAEQFLALLQESIQLRLMSEVPLGALLSGGLDSGMLAALIQANLSRALKTVSIGFEDPAYDEAGLAEALAQTLGTGHHAVNFTAADFDDYPRVMDHLEEPQCSATALPIYKLYRACREAGLTVVLTGEGADELLGGYHWHRGDALVRPLLALPAPARRAIAAAPLPMSRAARRVLARGARGVSTRYRDWLEVDGSGHRSGLLAADVRSELDRNGSPPLVSDWAATLRELGPEAPLHQMLWLETRTRLVDFINFEVDKMSMAASIEARVPFLDHKLWEFCASLPARYKLRGRIDKVLLRRAAGDILPEATRARPKKGLAAPYAGWLRAERLPEWAEAALSPAAIRRAGLFQPEAVAGLRRAHRAGQPNLGPLLMGVLSTQVWFQRFVERTEFR